MSCASRLLPAPAPADDDDEDFELLPLEAVPSTLGVSLEIEFDVGTRLLYELPNRYYEPLFG